MSTTLGTSYKIHHPPSWWVLMSYLPKVLFPLLGHTQLGHHSENESTDKLGLLEFA